MDTQPCSSFYTISLLPSSFSDPFNVDVTRDVISLVRATLKNGVGYTLYIRHTRRYQHHLQRIWRKIALETNLNNYMLLGAVYIVQSIICQWTRKLSSAGICTSNAAFAFFGDHGCTIHFTFISFASQIQFGIYRKWKLSHFETTIN